MLPRRRVSITAEGSYYLFVVVFIITAAVMREVNVLIILAGMLLGPWLLHWRMAGASLRNLRVERRLPEVAVAGQPIPVQITLHNDRPRRGSWCVSVEDRIRLLRSENRSHQPVEMLIPYVAAGDSAQSSYHWFIDRRGEYELTQLQLRTRFPFGLLQSKIKFLQPQRLLVGPRVAELTSAWNRLLASDQTGGEHPRPLGGRTDGDYYAIRPWRSGDSRRWIHWRSTARIGEPVVKQFERHEKRQLYLLLDLAAQDGDTDVDPLHVELAVSLVMSIVHDACRRRDGHLLLTIAGEQVCNWSTSPSQLLFEDLAARLATISTRDGLAQPGWHKQLDRMRPEMQPVVISTRGHHEGDFANLGLVAHWIDCRQADAWQFLDFGSDHAIHSQSEAGAG